MITHSGAWGRLYRGDCLDVLRTFPDASVDSLVTDPPCGISFMNISWDDNKGGRDHWIDWMLPRMSEALRVCRTGALALVWALPRTSHWTATALELGGWDLVGRRTHLFGQGMPKAKTRLKPAGEDWWLAVKPGGTPPVQEALDYFYCPKASPGERDAGLPEGAENTHPTIKSLALCRWLLGQVAVPGDVVLDPFCGSGSIGAAAASLGMTYLGIDDADWLGIAAARISHHRRGVAA